MRLHAGHYIMGCRQCARYCREILRLISRGGLGLEAKGSSDSSVKMACFLYMLLTFDIGYWAWTSRNLQLTKKHTCTCMAKWVAC